MSKVWIALFALVLIANGSETSDLPKPPIIFLNASPFAIGPRPGPWVARCQLTAYQHRGSRDKVAFEIQKGETFNHHGSDLIIEQPGVVRMLLDSGDIKRGDKVHLLDHRGEGIWGYWFKGKTFPCGYIYGTPPNQTSRPLLNVNLK